MLVYDISRLGSGPSGLRTWSSILLARSPGLCRPSRTGQRRLIGVRQGNLLTIQADVEALESQSPRTLNLSLRAPATNVEAQACRSGHRTCMSIGTVHLNVKRKLCLTGAQGSMAYRAVAYAQFCNGNAYSGKLLEAQGPKTELFQILR